MPERVGSGGLAGASGQREVGPVGNEGRTSDPTAAYTELEAPLYPHRNWVEAGKCGRQPLKDLEAWVKGGTFHRYGVKQYDRGPTVEEALQRMRDYPAILEFRSEFDGHVMFSIRAQQAGDPESWLWSRPHFTPEDASYAALSMIEEHEREIYVGTVVGALVWHVFDGGDLDG